MKSFLCKVSKASKINLSKQSEDFFRLHLLLSSYSKTTPMLGAMATEEMCWRPRPPSALKGPMLLLDIDL